jgi:hypothetical protein
VLFWEDLQALSDCEEEAGPVDSLGSDIPPDAEANLRAAFTALAQYTATNGLPPAVPFTPNAILEGACPTPQWEPGGFAAIGFVPNGPRRFAYGLNVDAQNDWELLALGDADCTDERILIRMSGGVDNNGGLYRNPGMDVQAAE